jgi:hypothetical protein
VLASHTQTGAQAPDTPGQQAIYRGQSPDDIRPLPARDVAQADERGPVTVASASGSIYAEAAARAERERQATVADERSADSGASVYDASRDTGVLRR